MALIRRRSVAPDGARNLSIARNLLTPLAQSPHRSSQQNYALQLVEWIDAGANGNVPLFINMPEVEIADD